MRIGAMVVAPGAPAEIVVYDPPHEVIALWGSGASIINQAELHAAPVVTSTMPDMLREADVIWFIDNSAAEAALIKAGSPTQTMCTLALLFGLLFFFAPTVFLKQLTFAAQWSLMLLIMATGNYNFFNILYGALCLSFADDRWWRG